MGKSAQIRVFETASDKYARVKQIGSGGSGIVVEVQSEMGKAHALKYFCPDHVTGEKRKRFRNELSFCAQNRHANIITVVDWGFVIIGGEKCPFYVMPLYPATLRDVMKNGLASDRVLPLFSRVLDGVEAAHMKGIWHRDLKPENILHDPAANQIVVADFGIAHFAEEHLQTSIETKPTDRLANWLYAAPEQRVKGGSIDQRADIYALGKILNEMFTGTVPDGVAYKTVSQTVPPYAYLDDLISLMLRQSPEERPTSIDEIKKELMIRGNAFVVRQKLNELERTVVPTSEAVDPLIRDPVRVVEVDAAQGHLILRLSHPVNRAWEDAFRNMRQFTHIPDECAPSLFGFDQNVARIPLRDVRRAQEYVDLFKGYMCEATKEYERILVRAQREEEQRERDAMQARLAEQQRREFILKNVRV